MNTKWMYPLMIAVFGLMLFTDATCLKEEEEDKCIMNRHGISENAELIVDSSTMYIFSVANMNYGVADGDKDCHATMELQFWFKDTSLAKTPDRPPVEITFFGGGGYFDPASVDYETVVTNGKYYWTAICDQAAKNSPSNPCDFGIWVSWDLNQILNLHDVGLSATIYYAKYVPAD